MIALDRESPAAAHWSRERYENLIAPGDSRFSEHFALVADDTSEDTCEDTSERRASDLSHQVLAFLVAHRVGAEWELENIIVARNFQRRGVGMRLLTDFIDHVRAANGRSIFLEVRESNQSARALYRKLGFEEAGLRKSYYRNPQEDAILCRLSVY